MVDARKLADPARAAQEVSVEVSAAGDPLADAEAEDDWDLDEAEDDGPPEDGASRRSSGGAAPPQMRYFRSATPATSVLAPHPSVFVAVMSRRDDFEGRKQLRALWPSDGGEDPSLVSRFVLCKTGSGNEEPEDEAKVLKGLQREAKDFADLLLLSCQEGYGGGHLTRKVLMTMEAYREHFPGLQFFMKTDDDTFVAKRELGAALAEFGSDHRAFFMGVPFGPQKHPDRNPQSRAYEPPEVFPDALYPEGFHGGPGYVLSAELVQRVLATGVAEANLLWNEDRAVSVWVDKLRSHEAVNVDFVSLGGFPAFSCCSGPWRKYSTMLHHKLSPGQIACLARLADAGDAEATVDTCFSATRRR